jgi:DNA-binding transcriptional ArsR family regulator
MLNNSAQLDRLFNALSDRSRRVMVERLTRGPAPVTELARPLAMSLPSVMQHLEVLQAAGLVHSKKVGRVRTCSIQPKALSRVEHWLNARRVEWEQRLDRLGAYLESDDT